MSLATRVTLTFVVHHKTGREAERAEQDIFARFDRTALQRHLFGLSAKPKNKITDVDVQTEEVTP